jgi:Uma2 family endonuclease
MSMIGSERQTSSTSKVATLNNGDRLSQAEFHRRYEACPEDVKFELIGGIVYMASPLRLPHSDYDDELGYLLGHYRRATPGVQALHGASAILGKESEPQPDLGLRILPAYEGQSRTTKQQYIRRAPELLAEIAFSAVSIDMHLKKQDYERAGVWEYIVVCVEERELFWFDFKSGQEVRPDARGVYKAQVFPGLWIDGAALLAHDSDRVRKVLDKGLASADHAAFVKRLLDVFRRQPRR